MLARRAAVLGAVDSFPGATFGVDYVRRRGKLGTTQYADPFAIPGSTFTRASTGYAETSGGVLVPFASGVPRITDKGLLVEEARTNLLLRSQEFDNASWVINTAAGASVTVTPNATAAPDGTTTADLIASSGLVNDFIRQGPTLASGVAVAGSLFVKNSNAVTTKIQARVSATALDLNINWTGSVLDSLTLTTGTTASFTSLADGWYRVLFTYTTSETDQWLRLFPSAPNDGKAVYAWGAQLEAGSFATSYIPTTTASATRAADLPLVSGLSGLDSDFSLVTEAEYFNVPTSGASAYVQAGSVNERFGLYRTTGSGPIHQSVTGGVATTATFSAAAGARILKGAAASFSANSRASFDGAAVAQAAGARPVGLSTMVLGGLSSGGSTWLNGYLRRAAIYPYAMTDAQLQAATT